MKTRLMLLIAVVFVLVAALPAAAQDTVTVQYWHTMSDPETAKLDEMIAAFEAANPGTRIEATRFAYDDFKQALLTGIAGGEPPDVARLDIVWVPQFAKLGSLEAMDTAMPDLADRLDEFFPGALATNYWDGQYWGLPVNTNTQVLLYNAAQFEAAGLQPPATVEDFVADACALTTGEEQYGYALGGTYFWAPAPLFYAQGGSITDADVTTADGYINSPESVAAYQTLVDLYNQGCISPNLLGGGIGTADGHATGLYSMIIDGPWMVDIYKDSYPDFEVNFALVPSGANGTSSVVGGEDVVLFANSPERDAAIKWMDYLVSEDYQLAMAQVGVIPTLASLTGNETLPAYFGVFMEQLATAQARTPTPVWSDIDNAINNAFQYMLRGEKDVQTALDDAAAEIDALLAG
ncbi:MAG TPA: extracellular solute-binding protein [Candidatus Limnocylindrales bacterium]|nr:extracellular solute-binding protein [Candidatus Limnocylindrales bacterium]